MSPRQLRLLFPTLTRREAWDLSAILLRRVRAGSGAGVSPEMPSTDVEARAILAAVAPRAAAQNVDARRR